MSAVSTRTRFEIFKRDKFTCVYCGQQPPSVILHVDHIHPLSKGGDSSEINLITACAKCNMGKSNVTLDSIPRPLAELQAEEREKHEQVEQYNLWLMENRKLNDKWFASVAEEWTRCDVEDLPHAEALKLTSEQTATIRYFLQKIAPEKLVEFVIKARQRFPDSYYTRKRFKYFCGCCWGLIKNKPKNWPAFFSACGKDEPHEWVVELMRNLKAMSDEHKLLILSGRSDEVKAVTESWLAEHTVPYDFLRMRRAGDYRPDEELKLEMLMGFLNEHNLVPNDIQFIVDDRQRVVDMWRENGFNVLQCAAWDEVAKQVEGETA